MRRKISLQLTAGFIGIVAVTVLVVGVIFISLYQRAALEAKRQDMLMRARNLAPVMAEYMNDGTRMRGIGGFFRVMDLLSDAQIWVLDAKGEILTLPGMGMGMPMSQAATDDPLPADASAVVREILQGRETVSEGFSGVYGETTLTAGAPVVASDGAVLGAVLLHASVKSVTSGLGKVYGILALGLGAGLLAAILLGTAFSFRFSKPLRTMNRTACAMAAGDYGVRNALKRQDEFGQLGEALDSLAASLEKAEEESIRLEQTRRDFIANVSHEFRTPLTVIRGSAEAVLDGTAGSREESEGRLRAILAETEGMNRLVGDLLELARLESGRVTMRMEPVWLGELLDDVWRSASAMAAGAQVRLERSLPESIPPVLADYGRLRQMLFIFLDNAVKHSPAGAAVEVHASRDQTGIALHVRDHGRGIPAEDLAHVWERFYTVNKARNQHGTGLGLPIARQISERMNSPVELNSAPEEGTDVVIHLRAAEMPED